MFQTAHGRRLWRFDSEQRALIFRRQLLQDEPGVVFATLCPSTKHRVIAYHEVEEFADCLGLGQVVRI